MPTRHGYDQPNQEHDDDPDELDLDLDIQELGSGPYHGRIGHRQPSPKRSGNSFGGRIALRNLRTNHGRTSAPADVAAEELQTLWAADEGEHSNHAHPRRFDVDEEEQSLLRSGVGGRSLARHTANGRGPSNGPWTRTIRRLRPFVSRTASIKLPSLDAPDDIDEREPAVGSNRLVCVASSQPVRYPPNAISNAKYTPWSFLPRTLFNEFKFFFNMYFLLVALSQIVPALRIGYLSTYIAPLAFVISITLGKEAFDDVNRRKRDREANSESYRVLRLDKDSTRQGPGSRKQRQHRTDNDANRDAVDSSSRVSEVLKPSRDLKVGDVVILQKDQRVPADLVILKSLGIEAGASGATTIEGHGTSSSLPLLDVDDVATAGQVVPPLFASPKIESSAGGEAFIRTDQLDGETDWKLRLGSPLSQALPVSEFARLQITAGPPERKVNDFVGTIELAPEASSKYDPPIDSAPISQDSAAETSTLPLTIDNTAWANTVVASSTDVYGVVVYTGPETRAALGTSASRSKTGLLEYEINALTKILCFLTAVLSLVLVLLQRAETPEGTAAAKWYVTFMRFLILFSTIVPISLRVNLDMGKSVYAYFIHRDQDIPGTIVRTSTIPEDLGRIEYLLSDKTGTLTRNEMELRKVHIGTVSYGGEAMDEVASYLQQALGGTGEHALFTPSTGSNLASTIALKSKREMSGRIRDLVLALALCHNVTPTTEEDASTGRRTTAYQASSPDEIAIVQWTEAVGIRLAHRDRRTIRLELLRSSDQSARPVVIADILNVFPFTSESKRMGIIVRFRGSGQQHSEADGDIVFYQKGADTVMSSIVAANDWLDEETGNMAREGLRTLVIGRKSMSSRQYAAFSTAYADASLSLTNRDSAMARVIASHLEQRLELLGVTGVEDKLQAQVKPSLEMLRNAGIKIWMLTGDKVETARCVAISSKLVSRGQYIHTIAGVKRKEGATDALSMLHSQTNAALLIDGQSLAIYLQHLRHDFIATAVRLPVVIACRCSPTQKAEVALLIRAFTKKRIACIGDGGNDVSMIQAADVGVGIVGKEGRQASLAADFSITQFSHLTKLLVWHGRNSYKRSAKLAQFVIHRGLIISVCQTVFSVASRFEPIALYRDWLLVGYATVYTMMPVFSLVLDRDVDEGLANLYPELYRELTLGKSLSYKTFFVWVAVSIYQGLIIQGGSELLVPGYASKDGVEAVGFRRMVAVSYTVLILNELLMVACEVTTWHPVMIVSIVATTMAYLASVPFLRGYIDLQYVIHPGFWWRFAAILAASIIPVYAGKMIRRTLKPPSYRKVRGI